MHEHMRRLHSRDSFAGLWAHSSSTRSADLDCLRYALRVTRIVDRRTPNNVEINVRSAYKLFYLCPDLCR